MKKNSDYEKEQTRPVWNKYALTIREASAYFGIGEKKLRRLIDEHPDQCLAILNGVKVLVKRKAFEAFLNQLSAI